MGRELYELKIKAAVKQLCQSERGVKVRDSIGRILREDAFASLDNPNWNAVLDLMIAYRAGYRGDVLDALDS